jgi:Secretion system C-terminal sorting domain
MKRRLLCGMFAIIVFTGSAQITSPVIRANFGVDADLRANFFNGFLSAGNDDWFSNLTGAPGAFMIDTTGASFILNRYYSNPATRMQPFFRSMRHPQFSVVNNRLLIDGIFIRDHHGDDSTVFASGSNKNGMSPQNWSTPVSQGIPDKNDILDMMMHVRRDGPNSNDSLWLFGGISLANTTGNRYFDFEMYQTDIVYNKPTLSFTGYGPDEGHTSWTFDGAGNVTKAGDIIFSAEYSSSSLSSLEARIWVHQSALLITPANFSWGGSFDGGSPGAVYGYANIHPKTAGNFYTGLQCANNTWAGPFGLVLQDNSVVANYNAKQFMEFSVNLSKLGLDPLITVNDPCAMPFRRILVKSRASTSFTAELKDFVGPFSFFRAPAVNLTTNFPVICGDFGISNIWITNPLVTSLYTWYTTNGNIVGDTIGSSITVNQPGTYIVKQLLMDSCGTSYARDTIVITKDLNCTTLASGLHYFNASLNNETAILSWSFNKGNTGDVFEVERSINHIDFNKVAETVSNGNSDYNTKDHIAGLHVPVAWYRLKIKSPDGRTSYSRTVELPLSAASNTTITVAPNPVSNYLRLTVPAVESSSAEIIICNSSGAMMLKKIQPLQRGTNVLHVELPAQCTNGFYTVQIKTGETVNRQKIVVFR